jgi:hypothetical protein
MEELISSQSFLSLTTYFCIIVYIL